MPEWVLRHDHASSHWGSRPRLVGNALIIPASPSGRFPRIQEGDRLILARLEDRLSPEALGFFGAAEVRVRIPRLGQERGAEEITLELSAVDEFDAPRMLTLFAYSLLAVYRHGEPWRHFSRTLRRIERTDYETIVSASLYVRRSVFHLLYDPLPRRVQLAFQGYCLARNVNITDPRVRYEQRLVELLTFVDRRLLPAFQSLEEARLAYTKIRAQGKPEFEHLQVEGIDGSGRPYTLPIGTMAPAIAEAASLAARDGPIRLLSAQALADSESETDRRFERIQRWTLPT